MYTITLRLIAVALVVLVAVAPGSQTAFGQRRADNGFLVSRVRVFDGEQVLENAEVAVEGGVIRAVGRDLTTWRHLPAIDGTGTTLMPGLIDAHVHVRDSDDLRQALRFGVTTVLDLGATIEPDAIFALRSAANASVDMSDLRVAGYVARARGEQEPPSPLTSASTPRVSTPADARQFVAMRRAEGTDYLKITSGAARVRTRACRTLTNRRSARWSRQPTPMVWSRSPTSRRSVMSTSLSRVASTGWFMSGAQKAVDRRSLARSSNVGSL